jgi:hypothetical protein
MVFRITQVPTTPYKPPEPLRDMLFEMNEWLPVFLCSRVPLFKGERYDVGTLCLSSRGGHVLASQMLDVGESSGRAFDAVGDIRTGL